MSSFFDEASLVFIPSGYKTSKAYSVKPTDGTGDLTFSRSNDTATRVGPDGLIEKVRTNLALYSEDLTNAAYVNQNANITANTTTAPDGTTTADTYNEGTLSTAHRFYQQFTITANAEYGFSFYAKKNTLDVIRLVVNDLGENFRWFGAQFDLTNGTITATATGSAGGATYIGGSITNVGNGWYRCSVNGTINTTTALCFVHSSTSTAITLTDDRGGISYTGTSRTYFGWGFQFETGVATPYIATTSAAVSVGPVANVPRLDYLGSTCGKLLLEPQRTNLVTYSEQFDNAAWAKNNTTISTNFATSPSGNQDADKIIPSTGNTDHNVDRAGVSVSSNGTASVFLKQSGYTKAAIRSYFTGGYASFDLVNGTILASAGVTAKIENYGNGWYRCSVNDTGNASYGYVIAVLDTSNDPTATYVGDGTSGVLAWGAQLEAGAYATSYIPTLGAAVTRGADAALKTSISSLIGQDEGTIFVEFEYNYSDSTTQVLFKANQTTDANSVGIEVQGTTIKGLVNSAGGNIATITGTIATGTIKAALAYKTNDMAFYVNGTQVGVDTSGSIAFAGVVDILTIGQFLLNGGTFFPASRPFNQALVFKTRLSNSDLAALTA